MKILEAGEVRAFAETFLSDIFLRGAVRAVLDAAPEYKPKPAWVPVAERLPATKEVKQECGAGEMLEWEESGECLCYTVFESVRVCRFYRDENGSYWLDAHDKSCDVTSEVTHWMELPGAPTRQDDEKEIKVCLKMPHAWALVESSFPTFTEEESSAEKITQLVDYMKILTEALQYQLENLDTENWNTTALEDFQVDTTKDVSEQLAAIGRQLTILTNEVYSLSHRLSAVEGLSGRVTQTETDIAWLEQRQEETAQDVAELQEQMGNAQADLDALEQEKVQTEERLSGTEESVTALQKSMAAVNGRVEQNELDIAYLERNQTETSTAVQQLQEAAGQTETDIEQMGTDLEQLREQLGNAQADIDALKNAQGIGDVAELQRQIEEAGEDIDELNRQQEDIRTDVEALELAAEELGDRLREVLDRLTVVEQEMGYPISMPEEQVEE